MVATVVQPKYTENGNSRRNANSDGNATNPDPLTQPTLADLSNKIKHIDDSVNGDEGNGTSNSRLR